MASIIVNEKERPIDKEKLTALAVEYVPEEERECFIKEVIFRMDALELDDVDMNGKSPEEYFFAACLAYAEENGYHALYDEMDDLCIFDYCGAELEDNDPVLDEAL